MMSQNFLEATLRTQASSKMSPKVIQKTISKMSNGRTTLENGKDYTRRRLSYVNHMRMTGVGCSNNMTEVHVVNSKDIVMSDEKGNLEEQGRIGDKHRVTRWGERGWTRTHERGYEYQGLWLWMIWLRGNDSERQNVERRWLKVPEQICTMALNAKTKEKWWHRLSKRVWKMALNAKWKANNGSKRQK